MARAGYTPKNKRTVTKFSERWGILAHELAEQEKVSTDAIHMRVMRFGTPFQRRLYPTIAEVMTGKTALQLASELNIHPITIAERLRLHGDHLYDDPNETRGKGTRNKTWAKVHWTESFPGVAHSWLMPQHPEYHTWRYKYIQKFCKLTHEPQETEDGNENTIGI
jgi:hypothetical protein